MFLVIWAYGIMAHLLMQATVETPLSLTDYHNFDRSIAECLFYEQSKETIWTSKHSDTCILPNVRRSKFAFWTESVT